MDYLLIELLILYLLKNTFRKLLFFLDQAVSFSIIQYNVFSVNTQSIFMDNKTFIILFIQDFSYYNSALYFIEINGNYFFENSTFFRRRLVFWQEIFSKQGTS